MNTEDIAHKLWSEVFVDGYVFPDGDCLEIAKRSGTWEQTLDEAKKYFKEMRAQFKNSPIMNRLVDIHEELLASYLDRNRKI